MEITFCIDEYGVHYGRLLCTSIKRKNAQGFTFGNFFIIPICNFWAPIMGVTSWGEFVDKIDLNRIEKLKDRFEEVKKSLLFYDDELDFGVV